MTSGLLSTKKQKPQFCTMSLTTLCIFSSVAISVAVNNDHIPRLITVEGTTQESTDVDQFTEIKTLNGMDKQGHEEVLIVLNNSTNVQRKVNSPFISSGVLFI